MLKQYLQQHADLIKKINYQPDWKYQSFEELILKIGVDLKAIDLPEDIELGMPKSCYWNCQQIIKKQPDLIYCEGYALIKEVPLPFKHAWLINSDKKVIDPTWETPGLEYIGIPFNNKWVQFFLKIRAEKDKGECLSLLEGNYWEKSSFLRYGIPKEGYCGEIR
ncbi:MAG: hypothetical protein QNJ54_30270 [Prochloraceae cyanobacterium]|nr:hypothetical protein [Prochloraceae cyanobacterium]